MFSSVQHRNSRHSSLINGFNTLIKTKSFPEIFKRTTKRSSKVEIQKLRKNSIINLRRLGFFSALLSLANIILLFYETELIYKQNFKPNNYINTIRGLTMLLCIIHSLTILYIHLLKVDKFDSNLYSNIKDLFTNRNRVRYFVIDVLLSMIHVLPGIEYYKSFYQLGLISHLSYSDMIFPFALLKIKFILCFFSNEIKESQKKNRFILNIFKLDSDFSYYMKSFIKTYSLSSFTIMLGFSIILFGITSRVFEKDESERLIWDYIWIGFTTESGVGYGEMYPITHIGRLIAGFGSVLGLFVFSYKIVSIRRLSTLSKVELKLAFELRKKKKFGKKYIPMAVLLIKSLWIYHKEKRVYLKFKLIQLAKEFKRLRRMLSVDLNPSLEQQITESGKLMSKSIKKGLEVFKEVNQFVGRSKKLAKSSYKNLKKLKKIFVKLGGNRSELIVKRSLLSGKILDLAKNRKNALKNLFIRKVANSPCFSSRSFDN